MCRAYNIVVFSLSLLQNYKLYMSNAKQSYIKMKPCTMMNAIHSRRSVLALPSNQSFPDGYSEGAVPLDRLRFPLEQLRHGHGHESCCFGAQAEVAEGDRLKTAV